MTASDTLCVTSFGPSGYELYGKRFLETFTQCVESRLLVYIEGLENKPDFEHPNVVFRDLLDVTGVKQTLSMTQFPAARGLLWGGDIEDYRFNVHKFCRKSFAQIDAATIHYGNAGKALYWIDADVEFLRPFPLPALQNNFMLYLGRPELHSCASFIGWNLTLPEREIFFKRYWTLYVSGTVFALKEWHDSYIVDYLRTKLKLRAQNLAAGLPLKGPANVFDKVFPGAHHKKGDLKFRPL